MAEISRLLRVVTAALVSSSAAPALAQEPPAKAPEPPTPGTGAAASPAAPAATAPAPAAAEASKPAAETTPTPETSTAAADPPAMTAEPAQPPPPIGWAVPADTQGTGMDQAPPIMEPLPPPLEQRDALSLIALYYSTAAPVSGTRDFGGGFSWSGFTFEGRHRVYQRLAAGVSLGWQSFNHKSRETVTMGPVTVTGVQARYQTVFPLLATAHYSFREHSEGAIPFVGLGLGAYSVKRVLDIGPSARFTDQSWHFGLAPEVGVAFPGQGGSLLLACKFHYAFEMDDAPQQTYFNFNLGGAFDG